MFEDLARDNIDQYVVVELGRPKWRDARVKVIEFDGQRAIFKDVHDRHPLFRFTLGRCLIRREFRLYRVLQGTEGVPRAYRMIDRDGFVAECIDGEPLSGEKIHEGLNVSQEFYSRCMDLVGALHARRVVHLDLRNKKNLLCGRGDRAYVVDFASAVHIPRWVPLSRVWISLLGWSDRVGVLKMKRKLSPELLSDGENKVLIRFERIRAVLFPPAVLFRALRRFRRRRRNAKAEQDSAV